MLVRNKGNPADAEAIDVLLAISEVMRSKAAAIRLSVFTMSCTT